MDELCSNCCRLEDDNKNLTQTIATLKDENDELKGINEELADDRDNLADENESLQTTVDDLENELNDKEDEFDINSSLIVVGTSALRNKLKWMLISEGVIFPNDDGMSMNYVIDEVEKIINIQKEKV